MSLKWDNEGTHEYLKRRKRSSQQKVHCIAQGSRSCFCSCDWKHLLIKILFTESKKTHPNAAASFLRRRDSRSPLQLLVEHCKYPRCNLYWGPSRCELCSSALWKWQLRSPMIRETHLRTWNASVSHICSRRAHGVRLLVSINSIMSSISAFTIPCVWIRALQDKETGKVGFSKLAR